MLKTPLLLLSTLTVGGLAACDSGDPASGPTDCSPGSFAVEIVFDEEPQTITGNVTSYVFLNAGTGSEGTLDIGTSESYALSLRWDETVFNGGSSDASGTIELGDGAVVGTCADDGYSGTISMYDEGGGGTFFLPVVRDDSDCAATARGAASGCFRAAR